MGSPPGAFLPSPPSKGHISSIGHQSMAGAKPSQTATALAPLPLLTALANNPPRWRQQPTALANPPPRWPTTHSAGEQGGLYAQPRLSPHASSVGDHRKEGGRGFDQGRTKEVQQHAASYASNNATSNAECAVDEVSGALVLPKDHRRRLGAVEGDRAQAPWRRHSKSRGISQLGQNEAECRCCGRAHAWVNGVTGVHCTQ